MEAPEPTPALQPTCACMAAPEQTMAAAEPACRSDRLWTAFSARWLGLCRERPTEEPEAR